MKKNLVMCHGQFLLKNKILLTLFASDGLRLFSHVIEATYDSWVPLYLIVFFLPFAKIKQSLGETVCEDDSTPPAPQSKAILESVKSHLHQDTPRGQRTRICLLLSQKCFSNTLMAVVKSHLISIRKHACSQDSSTSLPWKKRICSPKMSRDNYPYLCVSCTCLCLPFA